MYNIRVAEIIQHRVIPRSVEEQSPTAIGTAPSLVYLYPNRRMQAPPGIDRYLRGIIEEDLPSYGQQRFAFFFNKSGKAGILRRYWGESARREDPYHEPEVQVRDTIVTRNPDGTFTHGEEGPVTIVRQKQL